MRLCILLTALLFMMTTRAATPDPIRIEGPELSKLVNDLPDGGLPPVVAARNIQVFRATRDATELSDGRGWTYNHHQDMACWKGKLYVAWTNGEKDEDIWPSHEVYSTSDDGEHWSAPRELFPQGVSTSLRMYFFHAPNGHMLVIAGQRVSHDKLQEDKKFGAVVREIRADHSLGDVFTLINDPRCPAPPPMFDTSTDHGFVEACKQLLANRPFLETQDYGVLLGDRKMKWQDIARHDRHFKNFGKAFSYFHRADGTLVGIGKKGWTILSTDEGNTWSEPVIPKTLLTNNAKVWGVRTPDNRYALFYNPKDYDRYPLVMVTGTDGITFDQMRTVHGEVPRQRYAGENKNLGPQYVRGISEWATDDSRKDDAVWIVYSVNKEDIWVSRIPFPQPRIGWSTYSPKWAPVTVSKDGSVTLEDRDRYDYAKAQYTFAEAKKVRIGFDLEQSGEQMLNVELCDTFADGASLRFSVPKDAKTVQLDLDANAGTWEMSVDGKAVTLDRLPKSLAGFARISFQSDDWRGVGAKDPVPEGSDKPAAGAKFVIRDLSVK